MHQYGHRLCVGPHLHVNVDSTLQSSDAVTVKAEDLVQGQV